MSNFAVIPRPHSQFYGPNSLLEVPGLELWLSTKDPADITASGGVVSIWHDNGPYSTTNAFVSDGAASNTATTATKSLTGNQTLTVDLALTDYTPSADNSIFNKLSGNDGIALLVLTTGVVRLRIGDGASVTNVDSTAGTGVTDLTRCTLGVVWTDGVGASFTLNGAALGTAVAAVKTLTNAATTATIGSALAGVLYRVQIGSSYDFNPSVAARGATTVADGVSGTWTINTSGATGARISGARDLYQGTAASQPAYDSAAQTITTDGVNDYMKSAPFPLVQPEWVVMVGRQVSWTADDTFVSGNVNGSMNIGQSPTTPNIVIYAGAAAGQTSQLAVGVTGIITAVFNAAASSLSINRLAPNTGDPSSANGGGFTIGANGGGAGNFANAVFNELAIFSRAPSAAEITRVVAYLARKWGIST